MLICPDELKSAALTIRLKADVDAVSTATSNNDTGEFADTTVFWGGFRSYVHEVSWTKFQTDGARSELRKTTVGFVFQKYNLLPTLSAEDNIRIVQ